MDVATAERIDTSTLAGACALFGLSPVTDPIVMWAERYPDVLEWAGDARCALPIEEAPIANSFDMRRLVAHAGEALGCPVGRVELLGRCGRVYEVFAYPHVTTEKDPLFPICLVPLSQDYRASLTRYVQHLGHFPRDDGFMGRNKQNWYTRATNKMWDVVDQLVLEAPDLLAWQELAYLLVSLDYSRAAPLGARDFHGNRWEANVPSGQIALWRTQ